MLPQKAMIRFVAIILFLILSLVVQQSFFYRLDYSRHAKITELKKLNETNASLQLKESQKHDLRYIYDQSVSRLKMGFPKQIIYLYE